MFDIDKVHCVTIEQKLLYNIQEFLKPKEVKHSGKICQHCGKPHEKAVDYAICAKRSDKHDKNRTVQDSTNSNNGLNGGSVKQNHNSGKAV